MALAFKGTNNGGFGGYDLTSILEVNLKWWMDWALLYQGAFGVVRLDSVNYLNPDESRLQCVQDERYEHGRVWNGYGREWVWESGVGISEPPFQVSGVYIQGAFHPLDETGAYAHHVDYQHGRVIFDNPLDPEGDVRAEYCYRMVHVDRAESTSFRVLMQNAAEEFTTAIEPSGTPAREHQIWLPAVFIDTVRGDGRGLQLGGGQIKRRDVILQVFADRPEDRNLLMDWLDFQCRAAFDLADLNSITMPFDQYGSIAQGAQAWPEMIQSHPWRRLRIMDGKVTKLDSLNPNLFRARVTWTIEVDLPGI